MSAINLLSCISFHYVESRLQYLRQTLATQPLLAEQVRVLVLTNTDTAEHLDAIRACFPAATEQFACEVLTAGPLDHPFDLTWVHKQVLCKVFLPDPTFSHFLYLEDDIGLKPEGMAYWLEAREQLRPYGLYPSFIRVERSQDAAVWRSSDQTIRTCARLLPHVRLSPSLWFVNLPNPYQGMYLFDRELAAEHVSGPAIHRRFSPAGWQVRERAAQGQTFVAVPRGFIARNAVPFDPRNNSISPQCFVHHLPNTYADDPGSPFGKLTVPDGLLAPLRLTARTVLEGVVGPLSLGKTPTLRPIWVGQTRTLSWGQVWKLERAVMREVWASAVGALRDLPPHGEADGRVRIAPQADQNRL